MDIIYDSKAKYIVNFAAQGMVAESWKNPEQWYQTNVVANVKFHDNLRKLDFLEKYVHRYMQTVLLHNVMFLLKLGMLL